MKKFIVVLPVSDHARTEDVADFLAECYDTDDLWVYPSIQEFLDDPERDSD